MKSVFLLHSSKSGMLRSQKESSSKYGNVPDVLSLSLLIFLVVVVVVVV